MLTQTQLKANAAAAAVEFVLPILKPSDVLGVGTGSTVDLFIDALAQHKHRFRGAVSSSQRSEQRMQALGIPVFDLNEVESMPFYVDGADEVDHEFNMIKGGGGALTREKIVASVAERFVCIVDESKLVQVLGRFPLPVEVIPMARAAVARRLAALGGEPRLRAAYTTDNGCEILDVAGFSITAPAAFEAELNNIPGVVSCGLFALSGADIVLLSTQKGMRTLAKESS